MFASATALQALALIGLTQGVALPRPQFAGSDLVTAQNTPYIFGFTLVPGPFIKPLSRSQEQFVAKNNINLTSPRAATLGKGISGGNVGQLQALSELSPPVAPLNFTLGQNGTVDTNVNNTLYHLTANGNNMTLTLASQNANGTGSMYLKNYDAATLVLIIGTVQSFEICFNNGEPDLGILPVVRSPPVESCLQVDHLVALPIQANTTDSTASA